eukprot:ANDGO_00272.mRNA.1 Chromosome transmission fidelity protein 18
MDHMNISGHFYSDSPTGLSEPSPEPQEFDHFEEIRDGALPEAVETILDADIPQQPIRGSKSSIFFSKPLVDHVAVTGVDGRRVFLQRSRVMSHSTSRMRSQDIEALLSSATYDLSHNGAQKDMSSLLDIADNERLRDAEIRQQRTHASISRNADLLHDSSLWVSKYAPSLFSDLLSEERTNREVLKWLLLMKKAPLKLRGSGVKKSTGSGSTEKPVPPEDESETEEVSKPSASAGPVEQRPRDSRTFRREGKSFEFSSSPLLILAGPPGIGKTTLAHILARHAGYNPVELNASDERTRDAVVTAIKNASQMRMIGSGRKKTCVILDECDGLTFPAVKGVVDLLKRGFDTPVVAVCNDLYVPVLRDLRSQASRIISMKPPTSEKLVARLRAVALSENLVWDSGVFSGISDVSEQDVRSCLHTMQFLSRHHDKLSLAEFKKLQFFFGTKDIERKNLFNLCEAVLFKGAMHSLLKHKRLIADSDDLSASRRRSVFTNFSSVATLVGDDCERLLDFIFANIWKSRVHDPRMSRASRCQENLSYFDSLSGRYSFDQPSVIRHAMVYSAIAFMQGNVPAVKLDYPQRLIDSYKLLSDHAKICASLSANLPLRNPLDSLQTPFIYVSPRSRSLIWAPFFVRLAHPVLRNHGVAVMTHQEKDNVQKVVDICTTYHVSFIFGTSAEEVSLDPALNFICGHVGQLPFIPVHVFRHIDNHSKLEKVKREEELRRISLKTLVNHKPTSNAVVVPSQQLLPVATRLGSEMSIERLNKGNLRSFIVQKRDVSKLEDTSASLSIRSSVVVFKYQQGHTNAVRKPLKMIDIL